MSWGINALQTYPTKFSLFWRESLWGLCLRFVLSPEGLFSQFSLAQQPAFYLSCISHDSNNLLPITFHPHHLKGMFETAVGLNFSTLCCKWGQLGEDLELSVLVCFYPQEKSLSHGSGAGVRDNSVLPEWHPPPLQQLNTQWMGWVASGLSLPLPAWNLCLSWGKGYWGPRILISVAPMVEPLFHD